jgi:hypothetical protein
MSEIPKIADAVLYEGYLLYPYRNSALKNLHRYPFGTLYPPSFCVAYGAGDDRSLRLECLLLGHDVQDVDIQLRFLHGETVRSVQAPAAFEFGGLRGGASTTTEVLQSGIQKLRVDVTNDSEFPDAESRTRDDALLCSLVSPHLILTVHGGEFASLIDPPAGLQHLTAGCRNRGTWPVLLGHPGRNTSPMLLAAPIILYDHPEIAASSPGDFFDGTEIDELLTLRLLTLTDGEKVEILSQGGPGKALLERTESLGIGATVRLHPSCRADILDLALAGKEATVRGVERDYEGRTYIAVTLNDDPGQDLGAFGHRFFMRPDELEPI